MRNYLRSLKYGMGFAAVIAALVVGMTVFAASAGKAMGAGGVVSIAAGGVDDSSSSRPNFNRPNFNRPDFNRPNFNRVDFNRPNFNRPNFNRVDFNRPNFNRVNVNDFDVDVGVVNPFFSPFFTPFFNPFFTPFIGVDVDGNID
jgi:uncharacterized protein YjbI with pentapeptide repeats